MTEHINESGVNVSVIQSLMARIQDLGRSIDNWNTAYIVLVAITVVLAALVFIAQFIVIRKSKELSLAQSILMSEKERLAETDSKDKDLKISDAKAEAAGANERSKKLESDNLNLRTDLENAKIEAAKAQLELRQYIDKKADPQRRLNREKFLEHMKGKPTAKALIWYKPEDTEAFQFAQQIGGMLASPEIGWNVLEISPFPTAARGTRLASVPSEMHFIGAAFTGLTLRFRNRPGNFGENDAGAALRDALMRGREGVGPFVSEGVEDRTLPDDVFVIVVGQKK